MYNGNDSQGLRTDVMKVREIKDFILHNIK